MVDLHCHILPGVDDGCASLDDALALARFCHTDGITHVVATPHCHRYVHLLRDDILPRVMQLNRDLATAEIPVTILPGSEIQVTETVAYQREFESGVYCHLGDGSVYTLLEFNWAKELYPADAVPLVRWLGDRGMTPILAHPERFNFFWDDPEPVNSLVDAGAWLQITVDSLLGNHGPVLRQWGKEFLIKYPNAVLATDAHNRSRCSGLSAGYAWVTENLGTARADDLRDRAGEVLDCILAAHAPTV